MTTNEKTHKKIFMIIMLTTDRIFGYFSRCHCGLKRKKKEML